LYDQYLKALVVLNNVEYLNFDLAGMDNKFVTKERTVLKKYVDSGAFKLFKRLKHINIQFLNFVSLK